MPSWGGGGGVMPGYGLVYLVRAVLTFSVQIALKLSKVESTGKKGPVEKPVIDIIIGSMKADIVDRKWDTQGSVSMKEVAILDYITTGAYILMPTCMHALQCSSYM